jgi:hypothetical protein
MSPAASGLLVWFGVELIAGGGHAGLAERVLGVAQAALKTGGGGLECRR